MIAQEKLSLDSVVMTTYFMFGAVSIDLKHT